jgi:hypothetical protein
MDLQRLLAAAERAEVRHRPVQADQPQKALDEACRLAERQAEQNLHRQAGLDRRISVIRFPTAPACGLDLPGHG